MGVLGSLGSCEQSSSARFAALANRRAHQVRRTQPLPALRRTTPEDSPEESCDLPAGQRFIPAEATPNVVFPTGTGDRPKLVD